MALQNWILLLQGLNCLFLNTIIVTNSCTFLNKRQQFFWLKLDNFCNLSLLYKKGVVIINIQSNWFKKVFYLRRCFYFSIYSKLVLGFFGADNSLNYYLIILLVANWRLSLIQITEYYCNSSLIYLSLAFVIYKLSWVGNSS